MPRARALSKDDIVATAMLGFWRRGYEAMSMDMIVKVTRSNRHTIYADFGGKRALFLACLEAYEDRVVTPAFAPVEAKNAGIEAIETYLKTKIEQARAFGLPGPGCLMANTMTEVAPHDPEVMARVRAYHARLQKGFFGVFETMNRQSALRTRRELNELADFLVIAVQGLWSASRTVETTEPLSRFAASLIYQIEGELNR